VKTLKVALMASLLIFIFTSVSIASAASSTMQGTATGYWSVANPSPGSYVTVTINFQSSSSSTLYVYAIGLHGDWMENDQFAGRDYSSSPEVVQTNGLIAPSVSLQIPASAHLGSHTYYIGIDGVDADGNNFSWDSSTYNIDFAVATNPTPTNGATTGPNSSSTNDSGSSNLLVYVAVIAVVAVVAILIAMLVVKKSGKKRALPVESTVPEPSYVSPPESPKPEQKPVTKPEPESEPEPEPEPEAEPEEKPNNKDFTI
jgi:hypothetical protein